MDRVETQAINHKKEYATHSVKSSKQKIGDVIIFILLAIGAVAMIFPLIYMVATSFMTKNQILSGTLTLFPDPILLGKSAVKTGIPLAVSGSGSV